MGAVFGFPVVASMPTIGAAVFVVGGIPSGRWTHDPEIGRLLIGAASGLASSHVLMLNTDDDELFPAQDVQLLFDSVSAKTKELMFWPGGHDDSGAELIEASADFLDGHCGSAVLG